MLLKISVGNLVLTTALHRFVKCEYDTETRSAFIDILGAENQRVHFEREDVDEPEVLLQVGVLRSPEKPDGPSNTEG